MAEGRWTLLPACAALGAPVGVGVIDVFVSTTTFGGRAAFLFELLVVFAYLFGALAAVAVVAAELARRRWRKALSWSVLPAAALTFFLAPGSLQAVESSADYIRFALLSPVYLRAAPAADPSAEPAMKWFYWVDASGLSGQTLVYLVFDADDGFAQPDARRTLAWKARAERTFIEAARSPTGTTMPDEAHHLFGHWYVVRVES